MGRLHYRAVNNGAFVQTARWITENLDYRVGSLSYKKEHIQARSADLIECRS